MNLITRDYIEIKWLLKYFADRIVDAESSQDLEKVVQAIAEWRRKHGEEQVSV